MLLLTFLVAVHRVLQGRIVDLRLGRRLITLGHLRVRFWRARGLPARGRVRRCFILLRRGPMRPLPSVSRVPAAAENGR